MRYVRGCLTAFVPWFSLLVLSSCKGELQWTSLFNQPFITNVRALKSAGTYSSGVITIRAEFSERIYLNTSGGTPTLTLNTSPNTAEADLTNCSTVTLGSNTKYVCDFLYVIRSNENSSLLDYVSTTSLNMNGGVIVNGSGYALDTTLPSAGSGSSIAQSNIAIDTSGPTVSYVTASPTSGTIGSDTSIDIIVTFNEAISVSSSPSYPQLTLSNDVVLTYDPSYTGATTAASNQLVFEYHVGTSGETSASLDYKTSTSLTGTIEDLYSNSADLTLDSPGGSNSLAGKTNLSINHSTSPTPQIVLMRASSSSSVILGTGESTYFIVRYNRNLSLSASPPAAAIINLNASYSDSSEASLVGYGSNTSELKFVYTASSGHSADSVNYSSASAAPNVPRIEITAGSIVDASNSSSADLILPDDSEAGSLLNTYTNIGNNVKVVPYARPSAPATFSANFIGDTTPTDTSDDYGIKLTWTPVSGATNYIIRRSVNSSSFSSLSNSSAYSELMDYDVQLGKTYQYEIQAQNQELVSTSAASASAELLLTVTPTFGSNGYDWNDYVQAYSTSSSSYGELFGSIDLSSLPTSNSCSSSSVDNYRDCIHGGERRKVVLYGITQSVCNAGGAVVNEFVGSTPQDIFEWSDCVWVNNTQMLSPITGTNAPTSVAVVYATRFKEGKGLKDLIDSGDWKDLKVKVVLNSQTYWSPAFKWWGNDVGQLPDNSGSSSPTILNTAGKVYYLDTSRSTAGYSIQAEKISVVTLDGVTLTWNGSAENANTDGSSGSALKSVFLSNSKNFLWVEANVDGDADANNVINFGDNKSSRIHNTVISNMCIGTTCSALNLYKVFGSVFSNLRIVSVGGGIFDDQSKGNLYKYVQVANSTSDSCIKLNSSNQNAFTNISVSNCNGSGIEAASSDNNNFSQVVAASAQDYGVSINGSYNTLSALTLSDNGNSGLKLLDAPHTIVHSALLTNNAISPSEANILVKGSGSQEITLSQLAIAGNSFVPNTLKVDDNAGQIRVTGAFIKEILGTCNVTNAGSAPGVDSSCMSDTTYSSGDPRESDFKLREITNGYNLFYGSSGRPNSTHSGTDTLYSSMTASSFLSPLGDASMYANIFNAWGIFDSFNSWPHPNFAGRCSGSDSCILNDWRLIANISGNNDIVLNTSFDGYNSNGSPPSTSCAAPAENSDPHSSSTGAGSILTSFPYDPSGITYPAGDNSVDVSFCETTGGTTGSSSSSCYNFKQQRFHKSAIEIIGDLSGDDDGLCEDGELCLYAPNFGAYQGHNTINSCDITTTNSNAIKSDSGTMLYYDTNGLP